MAKASAPTSTSSNGRNAKPAVSKLGKDLRRIREKIKASGEKMLTRPELEREVAERRGAATERQ